jgi:hypothetical protein
MIDYKKLIKFLLFFFLLNINFFFKEKSQLEEQLQEITRNLEESKSYIYQLQIQTKKEKRDRAKYFETKKKTQFSSFLFRQALNLTENIAIERENLVKQLDSLK